jgi:hypothetical protein
MHGILGQPLGLKVDSASYGREGEKSLAVRGKMQARAPTSRAAIVPTGRMLASARRNKAPGHVWMDAWVPAACDEPKSS